MDLLDSLRSRETYLERIPKSSTGTLACEKEALGNFDAFSEWKFHVSTQNMLAGLRKFEGRRQENPI